MSSGSGSQNGTDVAIVGPSLNVSTQKNESLLYAIPAGGIFLLLVAIAILITWFCKRRRMGQRETTVEQLEAQYAESIESDVEEPKMYSVHLVRDEESALPGEKNMTLRCDQLLAASVYDPNTKYYPPVTSTTKTRVAQKHASTTPRIRLTMIEDSDTQGNIPVLLEWEGASPPPLSVAVMIAMPRQRQRIPASTNLHHVGGLDRWSRESLCEPMSFEIPEVAIGYTASIRGIGDKGSDDGSRQLVAGKV
ncbi:hypothetical protein FRB93_007396 [Tulasnella sp. JGI-2019a]|nr:hypothetical protein FRB93_007396 [Tulasnella sp. JGI-2019a]